MVSGLEGSGLVLSNGSDNLRISANGSFAFATAIATGAAYNVTFYMQPANPSQTCVVTDGSGKMGSSNVTNASVVCTTGVANANLQGTFKMARYSFVPNGNGAVGDLVSVTFDGVGKFSGTDIHNYGGTVSSDSVSGTYTIAADGTLDISRPGSTMTGRLSANGKTLVASQTTSGSNPSVLLGIKHGQSKFSNADLIGIYKVVNFAYPGPFDYLGDTSNLLTLTFDGAGNFSGTDVQNNGGTIASSSTSGTYTVAADGTLTITKTGGPTITGGLSADSNTLVASQTTSGESPSVLLGIKQGQSDFSNANLRGTYKVAAYNYDYVGDGSELSDVTFDGAGNFDATGVQNQAGTVSSSAALGTYTVAADGGLTVTPTAGYPIAGGLGADGTTVVITQMTSNHLPQVLFGVESSVLVLTPDSIKIACQVVLASTRGYYACPSALLTLKNTGTSTLYVFGVSIGGQFAQANDCGASLNPGQTCAIQVRYNGPTSINSSNFKETIYTGQLLVQESISPTLDTAVTQKARLEAVLPKIAG
jgi:hypothetical protein